MRRRSLCLILVVLVVLAGVIVVLTTREREPEYGGKRLSEWVDELPESRDDAPEKAVRNIGTNGLPFLMKWMLYETPAWKSKVYHFVNPLIRHLNRSWQLSDDKHPLRAIGSFVAFREVGTNALPFLHVMMNDPDVFNRTAASNLLLQIAPQAAEVQKPQ